MITDQLEEERRVLREMLSSKASNFWWELLQTEKQKLIPELKHISLLMNAIIHLLKGHHPGEWLVKDGLQNSLEALGYKTEYKEESNIP